MSTILRIPVTDHTLERLQSRADHARIDVELATTRLVQQVADAYPLPGRVVAIGGDQLAALEEILGGGSVLSAADLLQKVERLAGISFLHLRLPFTPSQLEAFAEKAARQDLTVEQLVSRTAPRIYEQFFDLVERSR